MNHFRISPWVALLGMSATSAFAQAGDWQYRSSLYLFLPSLDTSVRFPEPGGSTIGITSEQILNSIEFAFMSNFEMNNGQWGVFTDLVYVELDAGRNWSPLGTNATIDYNLKGLAWTLAGEYRAVADADLTLDILAGVRLFDIEQTLDWHLATIPQLSRSGTSTVERSLWDGIVGVKGRYSLGASPWFVPFYADLGAGDSNLTWQAAAGISYAFSWGAINGLWRELHHDLGDDSSITNFSFSGPQVGVTLVF